MTTWHIVPEHTPGKRFGFVWRWKRIEAESKTTTISETAFDYYHDCVQDARKHGARAVLFGKETPSIQSTR